MRGDGNLLGLYRGVCFPSDLYIYFVIWALGPCGEGRLKVTVLK